MTGTGRKYDLDFLFGNSNNKRKQPGAGAAEEFIS